MGSFEYMIEMLARFFEQAKLSKVFIFQALFQIHKQAMMSIDPYQIMISYSAFLIALTAHEYAHAWVANYLGDPTPARHNRLEFNPLTMIREYPFGALIVPLIGALQGFSIGWAATPVNPHLVNRKYTMRQAERLIAVAGPAMNLILAIISSLALVLLSKSYLSFLGNGLSPEEPQVILISTLYDLARFSLMINLFLMAFNMIPVPPLDGFTVLANILPRNHQFIALLNQYQQIFLIFIFVFAGRLLQPFMGKLSNLLIEMANTLLGFF